MVSVMCFKREKVLYLIIFLLMKSKSLVYFKQGTKFTVQLPVHRATQLQSANLLGSNFADADHYNFLDGGEQSEVCCGITYPLTLLR